MELLVGFLTSAASPVMQSLLLMTVLEMSIPLVWVRGDVFRASIGRGVGPLVGGQRNVAMGWRFCRCPLTPPPDTYGWWRC